MRTVADLTLQLSLATDQGLSAEGVVKSRQNFGVNQLTPLPREPLWKKFIEKFDEPIIKILLAAALLSMVVDLFKADKIVGGVCLAVFAGIQPGQQALLQGQRECAHLIHEERAPGRDCRGQFCAALDQKRAPALGAASVQEARAAAQRDAALAREMKAERIADEKRAARQGAANVGPASAGAAKAARPAAPKAQKKKRVKVVKAAKAARSGKAAASR